MKMKLTKIEVILNEKDMSFDVSIAYGKIFNLAEFKGLENQIKKINDDYIKKLEEIAK